MEFRKMVMMTLYARQQKRPKCKEQTFGLCGRRRWAWDDLRKKTRNHVYYYMWNRWPVQVCRMKQGTQSRCTETTLRDKMRREAQDVGTHVHSWLIHINVWQKPPQYCKVISLQLNKFFLVKKKKKLLGNFLKLNVYLRYVSHSP